MLIITQIFLWEWEDNMAKTYKILGNVAGLGTITSYSTLYNTPSSTSAVISTITICNQTTSSVTYRIGIASSETSPTTSEFLAFGATVAANDTVALTLGVTLQAGKYLRVSSSSASVSFIAFGSELT
jgi:hypothetical protein